MRTTFFLYELRTIPVCSVKGVVGDGHLKWPHYLQEFCFPPALACEEKQNVKVALHWTLCGIIRIIHKSQQHRHTSNPKGCEARHASQDNNSKK
jgi:hypothetical protein